MGARKVSTCASVEGKSEGEFFSSSEKVIQTKEDERR